MECSCDTGSVYGFIDKDLQEIKSELIRRQEIARQDDPKLLPFIFENDFVDYILDPHRNDFKSNLDKALNKLWKDLGGQKDTFSIAD